MTSPHGAVAKPEYGVEMQAGLAVVALRNVADQAQYFALLIDGNRIVSPGSEIEPTDLGALERSDRRDPCRADGLLVGKGADSRKSLFVLIQNQNESPSVVFGSQFGFHEPPRGKDDRVSCDWNNPARSTLGYSPGSSWCNHLLPSWRASLLKKVTVGRRIKRSADNAASMANALNQPKRRSDGRSENTVTTRPQASTTEVRIKGGPTSTVARSTAMAGSWSGRSSCRNRLRKCIVPLRPNPKETVSATTLANCRPSPISHNSVPESTTGNIPGMMQASITTNERKARPMNAATNRNSSVRPRFNFSIMSALLRAAIADRPVTAIL